MAQEVEVEVPVLVVGGGVAGLTASMLLSNLGIPSLLVSRYSHTSQLPKAHILNQRTMEIFTDIGVAPAVLAHSTPTENMHGVAMYTGLEGDGPASRYARRIAYADGWGAGNSDPDYQAASACATANLPQILLEPILKRHAERQPNAAVRFHHELIDLHQDEHGVTAVILDHRNDVRYRVRSSYLLGADGGRTVAKLAGIEMADHVELGHALNVHMSADLSPYFDDPGTWIRCIYNPDYPEYLTFGCVIIGVGPHQWGHRSEEWLVSMPLVTDDPDAADPARAVKRIGESLGIKDFRPQIHHTSKWVMDSVLAATFQVGRVFILGDAAHRHPPTGGLGLNSAVHDAYNLCWKLAAVLNNRAGAGLLDTYTPERRPVAAANIRASLNAAVHHFAITDALGLSTDKTAEENWAALRPLIEDCADSTSRRHGITQVFGESTNEFRLHNIEFGYRYESAAVISDGAPIAEPLDDQRLYQPSTTPGAPLPHAWVERAGERFALRSLIHRGHFVLIAGEDGHDWVEAAEKAAIRKGIALNSARVGMGDVDLVDIRFAWLKNRGISRTGAVLVRPDGHLAFRSPHSVDDPLAVLDSALNRILATN
jgi:2,4-dichlorophenol 6-monooxygenase